MIPILADTIADGDFNNHAIMWIAVVGSPLLSLALTCFNVFRKRETIIGDQPVKIAKEKEFVTKKEFEDHRIESNRRYHEHAVEIRAIRQEIKEGEEKIIKAGSDRGKDLYGRIDEVRADLTDRIDTVLKAVSRVEGAIEEARTHR